MKKNLLLVTASLFALGAAAPAVAADLAARPYTKAPPPVVAAIYDWSGFYIGLNGGGGSSHKCWDILGASEGCHDATGGTVGGQVGYRWQAANWVFGLEGQGNWANFKGSNLNQLAGVGGVPAGLFDESKINSFGLLTGQVGYAFSNVLLYVKGGAAVVDDKYRTYVNPGVTNDSASETRWGGTIGAGLEFGFAPNWSVGVEYDHLFLGGRDVSFYNAAGALTSTDHITQDVDMGLVRLNYKFGGPVVAKY